MLQKIYKQFQSLPFDAGGSTQHGCNMKARPRVSLIAPFLEGCARANLLRVSQSVVDWKA
jgi:hypothetical protein